MLLYSDIAKITEVKILKNYVKSKFYFYFCILIEFYQIFVSIMSFSYTINNNSLSTNNNYNLYLNSNNNLTLTSDSKGLTDYLKYASISGLLKNYIQCSSFASNAADSSNSNETICYYSNTIFYIVLVFILIQYFFIFGESYFIFRSLHFKSHSEVSIKSTDGNNLFNLRSIQGQKFLDFLMTNMFDAIFHIMGSFILDLFINTFLVSFRLGFLSQYFDINIFVAFLSFFALIFYLINYLWFIRNINLTVDFSTEIKCPYDRLFSVYYGYLMITIKILINICNNLEALNLENFILFDFFKIFVFFVFAFFIIFMNYELYNGKIIYLINHNLNKLRLFNIFLCASIFIFEFFFHTNYKINIISFFVLACCFLTAISLTVVYDSLNFQNLTKTNKMIYHIVYVLNAKSEAPQDLNSIKKALAKFLFYHSKICKAIACKLHRIKDFNDIDSIIKVYLNELNRKAFHTIDKEDEELKQICLLILSKRNKKNASETLSQLFFTSRYFYRNISQSKVFVVLQLIINEIKVNLYRQYDMNHSSNHNANKKFLDFELINFYTDLFQDFTQACNFVFDIMDAVSSMSYDILFKNSFHLNLMKNKIIKKYTLINKFRGDYQDIYSFFFIKFLFKKLFSQKLHIENEMILPADFKSQIMDHYLYDNFLNLIFSENSLKIIKASKEYIKYIGKELQLLFPDFSRDYSKKKFIQAMEKSNGYDFNTQLLFQLPFDDNNKNFNIKLINLECRVYPSFALNELLLIVKCSPTNEEILIFEDNVKESMEYLKYCSDKISKNLCLSNRLLHLVKSTNITFKEIFTLKMNERETIPEGTDDGYSKTNEENIKKYYYIDYSIYKSVFRALLNYLKERDLVSEEEFFAIESAYQSEKNKLHVFELNIFEVMKIEYYNYKILKLSYHRNSKQKWTRLGGHNMAEEGKKIRCKSPNLTTQETNKDNESENMQEKLQELQYSENSQSFKTSSLKSSTLNSHKKKGDNFILQAANSELNKNSQAQNKRIKFFIYFLLGLILFLFIFGISILAISVYSILEIKTIFNLNFYFNKLITNYDGLLINIVQNICLKDENSNLSPIESANVMYKDYYDLGVKMDLVEYMSLESTERINRLRVIISNVKSLFYQVAYADIANEFMVKKIPNYFISNANNNITVTQKELTFFDNIDIFISSSEILAHDPNLVTFLNVIDTSQETYDFRYFYSKQLNNYQINAINLIINFETLVKNMEYKKLILYNLFFSEVDFIHSMITFSNIFLCVFHLFMSFLILFIVKYFKLLLHTNISLIQYLLKDEKHYFIKNKISALKRLSLLYADNPNRIMSFLKTQKENYKIKFLSVKGNKEDFNKNTFNNPSKNLKSSYRIKNTENTFSLTEDNLKNGHYNDNNTNNYDKGLLKAKKDEKQEYLNTDANLNILMGKNVINGDLFNKEDLIMKKQAFLILSRSSFFRQFMLMTGIFFFFFIIYFCFFYFFFISIDEQNTKQNKFAHQFWNINHKIVKDTFILNLFFLLNKTDTSLSHSLSRGDGEIYSYPDDINNSQNFVNSILKNVLNNPKRSYIKPYFKDYIDCEKIYSQFYNDEFYAHLNDIYYKNYNKTEYFASDNLKIICKSFTIMGLKNYLSLLTEAIQLIKNNYYSFAQSDKSVQTIGKLYSSQVFNRLTILLLLVTRPIRRFTEDNLFTNLIYDVFDSYITFIIVNLLLNFVVEFLFFILVKKYVINKTNKIDLDLKHVMKSLIV